MCAQDIPIDQDEERNSFMEALRAQDMDTVSIGQLFHVSHQRVVQILQRRKIS